MKESYGAMLIAKERSRQVEEEGFTEKDDDMQGGNLAVAGACYALNVAARISVLDKSWRVAYERERLHLWPWAFECWKPTFNDPIRELTKAGALIAAEIDRLHRKVSV